MHVEARTAGTTSWEIGRMLLAPLIFAAILFVMIYHPPRRGVRVSVILVAVATATTAVALNELLSVFHRLTAGWLVTAWGVCIAAVVLRMAASPRNRKLTRARCLRRWRAACRGMDGVRRRAAIVAAVILACTGLIALVSAPNNFDSVVYHLPRVMHWIQDQRIAIFPTASDRQAYQHPGAEHLQLEAMLLGFGDRFVNGVQWCALLLSAIAASLTARALGARPTGQWIASLLALTLPMAIFQSTNTKNDLLMAAFVLIAAWQILESRRTFPWPRAVFLGAILGWVLLIKGTCYAFVPPLAICLIIAARRQPLSQLVPRLAVVALIATLFILPHAIDNTAVFGTPLGPTAKTYTPSGSVVAAAVTNLARNLGTCLTTPIEPLNHVVETVLTRGLSLVGLDIHDARSMNYSNNYWLFGRGSLSEDNAGAPFHVALFIVTIPLILVRGTRTARAYLVALLCAAVFFSALVSWNQWIGRLFLPLLMLLPPLLAVTLRVDTWPRRLGQMVPLVCLVLAAPYLLVNTSRPLIGPRSILLVPREQTQFALRPELASSFDQAMTQVRLHNVQRLGLCLAGDDWEYPLWLALKQAPAVTLEHVGVDNATARRRAADYVAPDWVLDVGQHGAPLRQMWDRREYRRVWGSLDYTLYEAVPP